MNYLKIGNLKVSPTLLLVAFVFFGVIFFKASQNSVEFVEVEVSNVPAKTTMWGDIHNFRITDQGYLEVDGLKYDNIYVWELLVNEYDDVEILNDSVFFAGDFTGLTIKAGR